MILLAIPAILIIDIQCYIIALMTSMVYSGNRFIYAIREHIYTEDSFIYGYISADKAPVISRIISISEVMQSTFIIPHISPIPERIEFTQCSF